MGRPLTSEPSITLMGVNKAGRVRNARYTTFIAPLPYTHTFTVAQHFTAENTLLTPLIKHHNATKYVTRSCKRSRCELRDVLMCFLYHHLATSSHASLTSLPNVNPTKGIPFIPIRCLYSAIFQNR